MFDFLKNRGGRRLQGSYQTPRLGDFRLMLFASALDSDLDIAWARGRNPWTTPSGRKLFACTHKAETHIVVAVIRAVVVAISGTQVLRIVVPAAATYDAIGAHLRSLRQFQ